MRFKRLLLAATLLPVLYLIAFVAIIATAALSGSDEPDGGLPVPFGVLMAGHLLTILLIFAITAVYIVDVFRNPRIPNDQRALWAVVIFMGNIVAMPVYWWLHIRPPREDPPAEDASA